jgi:hypothetical protein
MNLEECTIDDLRLLACAVVDAMPAEVVRQTVIEKLWDTYINCPETAEEDLQWLESQERE